MKLLKPFICLGVLISTWFLGFFMFVMYTVSLKSSNHHGAFVCDAVVVFTGKGNRIAPAYDLFHKVGARAFFISGVDEDVQLHDLIPGDKRTKNIDLGYEAYNTHTNALETAVWMRKNNLTTVCLVTNLYHMPRSLLELKGFVKDNATILPYPITPGRPWWAHWSSFQFVLSEYHKYIVISLLQLLS